MGVKGLSSFLNTHRRSLSTSATLEYGAVDTGVLVVDAWSLIYSLYLTYLPPSFGGEYVLYAEYLSTLVKGWQSVGLKVIFVFDGPSPSLKLQTELGRLTALLLTQQLHSLSPSSSSSSFYYNNSSSSSTPPILPPLLFATTITTLKLLAPSVELIFSATEADGLVSQVASERKGWILGNDSDYLIYPVKDGKGYVEIEQMCWSIPALQVVESEVISDGWESAAPRKKKRQNGGSGTASVAEGASSHHPTPTRRSLPPILPPPLESKPSLTLTSTSSSQLAAFLKISESLLPLFSALCGNDYSPNSINNIFFPKANGGWSSEDRILRVSQVIEDLCDPTSKLSRTRAQERIEKKRRERLSTPTPSSSTLASEVSSFTEGDIVGEKAFRIIEDSITSLLLYPHSTQITEEKLSTLTADVIAATLIYTHHSPEDSQENLWLSAWLESGSILPTIPRVVQQNRWVANVVYEDTSRRTLMDIIGADVRDVAWSVLSQFATDEFGTEEEEEEEVLENVADTSKDETNEEDEEDDDSEDGDEDDDELIDVREEMSDDEPEDAAAWMEPVSLETESLPSAPRRRFITEHLRSSTRLNPIRRFIVPLSTLITSSFLSEPMPATITGLAETTRLEIYLTTLNSLTPEISALASVNNPAVLGNRIGWIATLRWMVAALHRRDKDPSRWIRWSELRWIIKCGLRSEKKFLSIFKTSEVDPTAGSKLTTIRPDGADGTTVDTKAQPTHPKSKLEVTSRTIHLTSCLLTSTINTNLLRDALLLTSVPLNDGRFYSGRALHHSSEEDESETADEIQEIESIMSLVLSGEMTEMLGKEKTSPGGKVVGGIEKSRAQLKKERKRAAAEAAMNGAGITTKAQPDSGNGGAFGALMDLDDD